MSPASIQNVRVVTPGGIVDRDILVDATGVIRELVERGTVVPDATTTDGHGCYAYPGMIDVLTHGYGEHHYGDAEPDGVAANSRVLLRHGVTAFVPSVLSKQEAELMPLLQKLATADKGDGARVLGLHSEGPCFAAPGAHKADNLALPTAALAEKMIAAADGQLRFVTVAPELPGAEAFAEVMRNANVGMHLGHSRALPHDVGRYVDMGVDAVTHMFDVMITAKVSEPGVYPVSLPDALMAEPRICLGLICDGVHADPIQVRQLAQLPIDRLFLETDSMKYTGLPPGRFELDAGVWVTTTVDRATRMDCGGLAGSTLTSDQALRNLIAFTGMDLARAAIATSLNPARLAKCADQLGSLEPGKQADIVLLDDALAVQATFVAGEPKWEKEPAE